jgi:uncharacterized protein (UPF0335 family)
MAERKTFLDAIRKLEAEKQEMAEEIAQMREVIDQQGEETFEMAGAVMAIRKEDTERLANFAKQNTILVEYVEKIADSQSKYRKEARQILGF